MIEINKETYNRLLKISDGDSYFCTGQFEDISPYDYLYDAEFTDYFSVYFPIEPEKYLENWDDFEIWIQNIHSSLEIYHLVNDSIDIYEDDISPLSYFGSEENIEKTIIQYLTKSDKYQIDHGINFVTLQYEKKNLYLVFDDADSWTLGHGECVYVIDDIEKYLSSEDIYKVENQ